MKGFNCTIFVNESSTIDLILDYLYRKNILKKILDRNDKFDYPYVIIVTCLNKNDINKILKSKFYNNYKLE